MRDLLTRSLPDAVRERLGVESASLADVGLAARAAAGIVEARSYQIEAREVADGVFHVQGYAATWDTWYDVAGGAPYGWAETVAKGAVSKSLAERDDVRFLVNHDGLPLARTKSGTMTLASDDIGLLVDAPELDLRNPTAAELRSALERGDVDEMSWAFMVTRQEWNEDYTERRILEARIFDVSAVSFPANPATIIGLRSEAPAATESQRGAFPLSLALAQAAALG